MSQLKKDGFSYEDGVFRVSNASCHARASPGEIYELVTHVPPPPALTKTGQVSKRQPKDPHQDPPMHFYAAQLKHYGLPPHRSREEAKSAFLAAFASNGGEGMTLRVPQKILDVEALLKRQWDALDDQSKAAAIESAKELRQTTGKSKSQLDSHEKSSDDKIQVGPTVVTSSDNSGQAIAKGEATRAATGNQEFLAKVLNNIGVVLANTANKPVKNHTSETAGTGEATTTAISEPPVRPKQTARRGTAFHGLPRSAEERNAPPAVTRRTKQTARKTTRPRDEDVNDDSARVEPPAYRTKQTARRGTAFHGLPRSSEERTAPPAVTRRTKQTARKTTRPRDEDESDDSARVKPPVYRTKQTARRGTAFGGGRPRTSTSWGEFTSVDSRVDMPEQTARKRKQREDTAKEPSKMATSTAAVTDLATKRPTKDDLRMKIGTFLCEDRARGLLLKMLEELPAAEAFIADATSPAALALDPPVVIGSGEILKGDALFRYYRDIFSGRFEIESSYLESQWSSARMGRKIFHCLPSSTCSHMWASFDFGIVSGVMRSVGKYPKEHDVPIHMEWRGRVTEDAMTFDEANRAIITIARGGIIEGEMEGGVFERFKFSGKRLVGPGLARTQDVVKDWKTEWRGMNQTNYENENTARWGKWGGEDRYDSPYESDTTDGRSKRRKTINLENFLSGDKGIGDSDDIEDEDVMDVDDISDDYGDHDDEAWCT